MKGSRTVKITPLYIKVLVTSFDVYIVGSVPSFGIKIDCSWFRKTLLGLERPQRSRLF